MYCTKCGAEVAADAKFCVKCGTKVDAAPTGGAVSSGASEAVPSNNAPIGANVTSNIPASPPAKRARPSLVMIFGGGFIGLCVIAILIGLLTGQGPKMGVGGSGSDNSVKLSEQAKFESDAMSLAKKLHSRDGGTREAEQANVEVEKLLSTYKNKAITGWGCKMVRPWTRGDKKYDAEVEGCYQVDYEADPGSIKSDKFDYIIKIPAESAQPVGSKIYKGDRVVFSGVIEKVELHKGFGGALYTGVGYEVKVLNGTIKEIRPK